MGRDREGYPHPVSVPIQPRFFVLFSGGKHCILSSMGMTWKLKGQCRFRYTHSATEPAETLEMAKRVAATVAVSEAVKTGTNHVVARLIRPIGYAVFPAGSKALSAGNLVPVYEITPASECRRLVH